MKTSKTVALAGALIAGLGLSSCGTNSSGPVKYQPGYPRAIPYFPYSADQATAERVRDALVAILGAPARSLTVQVTDGIVEISGRPNGLETRDAAVQIAKNTHGVNGVSDKMILNQGATFTR